MNEREKESGKKGIKSQGMDDLVFLYICLKFIDTSRP